jgi:hypothetical protein
MEKKPPSDPGRGGDFGSFCSFTQIPLLNNCMEAMLFLMKALPSVFGTHHSPDKYFIYHTKTVRLGKVEG